MARMVSSASPCSRAQVAHLPDANAVLARAGAAHVERAVDQAFVQAARLGHLLGTIGIHQVEHVEVAVADVADERAGQGRLLAGRASTRTMQSARREIGTQASVVQALAPGRSASDA